MRVQVAELTEQAQLIRDAIERADLSGFFSQMTRFPHGCCKLSSLVLILHLNALGIEPLELVANASRRSRDNPPCQSHAWVEHGDIIVDITADQFADSPGSVLVTRDHTWHGGFKNHTRHSYSELKFDDLLIGMYEALRLCG
jgi:hypothetical protein